MTPLFEPDTEPDGESLLDEVKAIFHKYTIQQSEHAYVALALYVAYTHASHIFQFAPRLLLTSAEKRSGKTRTMEVCSGMSNAPLIAANATVAAIFRSLGNDDEPRTLFFDEADTIFGTKMKAEQNEDLRGLINAGFQVGTPVLRTVGPNHTPTEFQTFAPVVMAAIGGLPDTITDRAVNIRLRRRKNTETVSQYRIRKHKPELLAMAAQLSVWIKDNLDVLVDAEPETPLEDRAADLWEPLLAIADLAGGKWPARARAAAVALCAEAADADSEHSTGVELLRDISFVLNLSKSDFMASNVLLEYLHGLEDSRWKEDNLTGRRLADLLKQYEITPRKDGAGNRRGYYRAKFEDAFARYLSGVTSEPSDLSEAPESRPIAPDTLEASDTSNRPTDSNRPTENTGNKPKRTLRTVRTPPRPEDPGQCTTCAQGTPTQANINRGIQQCLDCIRQEKSA